MEIVDRSYPTEEERELRFKVFKDKARYVYENNTNPNCKCKVGLNVYLLTGPGKN